MGKRWKDYFLTIAAGLEAFRFKLPTGRKNCVGRQARDVMEQQISKAQRFLQQEKDLSVVSILNFEKGISPDVFSQDLQVWGGRQPCVLVHCALIPPSTASSVPVCSLRALLCCCSPFFACCGKHILISRNPPCACMSPYDPVSVVMDH